MAHPVIEEKEDRFYYGDCSYDTLEDALLIGVFGCCGCAEAEPVFKIMLSILVYFNDKKTYKEITADILNGDLGAYYIATGILDRQGLIEHGVAIRYCWLTEKGKQILDLLKGIFKDEIPSS